MSKDSKLLSVPHKDGSATIFTNEAVQCQCGYMAAIMVNRDGKTRCLVCDEKYVRQSPKEKKE